MTQNEKFLSLLRDIRKRGVISGRYVQNDDESFTLEEAVNAKNTNTRGIVLANPGNNFPFELQYSVKLRGRNEGNRGFMIIDKYPFMDQYFTMCLDVIELDDPNDFNYNVEIDGKRVSMTPENFMFTFMRSLANYKAFMNFAARKYGKISRGIEEFIETYPNIADIYAEIEKSFNIARTEEAFGEGFRSDDEIEQEKVTSTNITEEDEGYLLKQVDLEEEAKNASENDTRSSINNETTNDSDDDYDYDDDIDDFDDDNIEEHLYKLHVKEIIDEVFALTGFGKLSKYNKVYNITGTLGRRCRGVKMTIDIREKNINHEAVFDEQTNKLSLDNVVSYKVHSYKNPKVFKLVIKNSKSTLTFIINAGHNDDLYVALFNWTKHGTAVKHLVKSIKRRFVKGNCKSITHWAKGKRKS